MIKKVGKCILGAAALFVAGLGAMVLIGAHEARKQEEARNS